ncbi:MAG: hypothetical protein ACD_75C02111G0004 [uncultured bacterium]|nr:MAG: hypothetical protein ACD_75C02111G0004 [uncultured bacterium]
MELGDYRRRPNSHGFDAGCYLHPELFDVAKQKKMGFIIFSVLSYKNMKPLDTTNDHTSQYR